MARGSGFEREFRAEMDRQARQMPRFSPDNVFCYWFLQAYVFGTGVPGVEAHVCGASRDGGFDAIAVDDYSNVIHLVQAKYRHPFGKRDNGKDLFKLIADTKGAFTEIKESRQALYKRLNARSVELLESAHSRYAKKNYEPHLYFLTTGRMSDKLKEQALDQLDSDISGATLEIIDYDEIENIFRQYTDGVAPPIPTVTVEVEGDSPSFAHRLADGNDRRCWVFPAAASSIARLYKECGIRLFAKNVRGYLGGTKINEAMKKTLKSHPEDFFYFNNGITIICSKAEFSGKDSNYFRLWNAQIVNGQQTARTIAEVGQESRSAVLVTAKDCTA